MGSSQDDSVLWHSEAISTQGSWCSARAIFWWPQPGATHNTSEAMPVYDWYLKPVLIQAMPISKSIIIIIAHFVLFIEFYH